MARLSLSLLGPLEAELDGQPITGFGYDKVRALLAYLAVEAQRSHRRGALVGLLWPELPDPSALRNLSQALFHLRRAVSDWEATPPYLLITRDAIQFNPASHHWLDVAAFDDLADTYLRQPASHSLDPADIEQLESALQLYRGPFLQSFCIPDSAAFEEWALLQRERLHRQAMALLCRLTGACEGQGQPERALGHAWRQLELDPWREESHQQVMRLLARSGRRSEALAQYAACRRVLAAELGVEPDVETTRLYEQIRDGEVGRGGAEEPRSRGAEETLSSAPLPLRPPAPQHNLPPDPTPLVGRECELAQVSERLAAPACRLLTVVGPGGVGKTRLAIGAARAEVGRYGDGVYLVDLAPVGAAELLAAAILRALPVPPEGAAEPERRLLDYLADKQMLLLLDNFEHLLGDKEQGSGIREQESEGGRPAKGSSESGVGLLVAILRAAPHVKLLVTSRERLNLQAEWLAPLEGLEVPGDLEHEDTKEHEEREARRPRSEGRDSSRFVDFVPLRDFAIQPAALERYGATQLFLGCVRRLCPAYQPEPEDAPHIARICRLLEGMPLGIELAAPWVAKLPLTAIADELAEGLDILTTTLRDVPPRHRSMRAAFDRSWRLLSPCERSLLCQLSVFRGGFAREAAEAVAGAALGDLSGLVDKSWLRVDASGRYGMHELIRQYCGERLEAEHRVEGDEDGEQVRARHCRYYAAYLQGMDKRVNWQPQAVADISSEFGNVAAAWHWAIAAGEWALLEQMVTSLFFMAEMEGRYRTAIELFGLAIRALRAQGLGCPNPALGQEAALVLVKILFVQRVMHSYLGRFEEARSHLDEGMAVLAGLEPSDRKEEWQARFNTQVAADFEWRGDFATAARMVREWLSLLQETRVLFWPYRPEIGTLFYQAQAYKGLSDVTWLLGQYEESQRLAREGLAMQERIGERRVKANTLRALACALGTVGAYPEAERASREGLALSQAQGDRINAGRGHIILGRILTAVGRHAEAEACFSQSLAIARESDTYWLRVESFDGSAAVALARGDPEQARRLFQETLDDFERTGRMRTYYYTTALVGLGQVALATADVSQARKQFRAALAAPARPACDIMDAIAGMAQVIAAEGDVTGAVELLAFVAQHPFTSHASRERARALLRELEAELPAVVFAEAAGQGRARELEGVVGELTGTFSSLLPPTPVPGPLAS